MTQQFHVERVGRESWQGCTVTVPVKQVTNRWTINRRCAAKPEFLIRLNDNSWGNTYCALHARLRIEELQTELLAEPEEQKAAAS